MNYARFALNAQNRIIYKSIHLLSLMSLHIRHRNVLNFTLLRW